MKSRLRFKDCNYDFGEGFVDEETAMMPEI